MRRFALRHIQAHLRLGPCAVTPADENVPPLHLARPALAQIQRPSLEEEELPAIKVATYLFTFHMRSPQAWHTADAAAAELLPAPHLCVIVAMAR